MSLLPPGGGGLCSPREVWPHTRKKSQNYPAPSALGRFHVFFLLTPCRGGSRPRLVSHTEKRNQWPTLSPQKEGREGWASDYVIVGSRPMLGSLGEKNDTKLATTAELGWEPCKSHFAWHPALQNRECRSSQPVRMRPQSNENEDPSVTNAGWREFEPGRFED